MPRLRGTRHVVNPDTNKDKRPSNWHEDQNERDMPPMADFATDLVEEPDLGFVPPANPQPVYLTEPVPGDNKLQNWSAGSATITSKYEQLAGPDRRRTRLVIYNNSTDKFLYVGRRSGDLPINMFPLRFFGNSLELLHNDEVWVTCLAGETAPIGWITEFDLEDT